MNEWKKMRDDEYHARQELSSSQIRKFMKSPLTYFYYLKKEDTKSDAMRFGTAAHLALLQPDEFGNQVVIAPECDRRTKEGKAIWEKFQGSCKPEMIILKEHEWRQASAMAHVIRTSREFAPFIEQYRGVESAGFATIDGIDCRIKVDILGKGWMLDYKTTTSCGVRAFENSVNSYGYAIQAAFYCLVAEEIDGSPISDFFFIAQEKSSPYEWRPFRMDPFYLKAAKTEVREAIKRMALCRQLDDFPGISKEVVTLCAPRWFDGTAPLFGEIAEGDE